MCSGFFGKLNCKLWGSKNVSLTSIVTENQLSGADFVLHIFHYFVGILWLAQNIDNIILYLSVVVTKDRQFNRQGHQSGLKTTPSREDSIYTV